MGDTYPNPFPDDRHGDSETISLTDAQRARAREALEALDEGSVSTPSDLVDWRGGPINLETNAMALTDDYRGESRYVWISGEDITGTTRPTDYFKTFKLCRILEWLLEGIVEVAHRRPPQLASINGDLYVGADGLHRSLAYKIVGVDRVRVRVTPYSIPEPGYRYWCHHRDAGLLRPTHEIKEERETRSEREMRLRPARRRSPQRHPPEPEPDGMLGRLRQLFS